MKRGKLGRFTKMRSRIKKLARRARRGPQKVKFRWTAAKRAAFRKMRAGLLRARGVISSFGRRVRRKRRRQPTKGRTVMARRRRRSSRRGRRNPSAILVNPTTVMYNPRRRRRSRRRNPTTVMYNPRRKRRGRRFFSNPAGSIKGSIQEIVKAAIPAVAGGAVIGFIDAKFLAKQSMPIRLAGKAAVAIAIGMVAKKALGPYQAGVATGAVLGSIGYDLGRSLGGLKQYDEDEVSALLEGDEGEGTAALLEGEEGDDGSGADPLEGDDDSDGDSE